MNATRFPAKQILGFCHWVAGSRRQELICSYATYYSRTYLQEYQLSLAPSRQYATEMKLQFRGERSYAKRKINVLIAMVSIPTQNLRRSATLDPLNTDLGLKSTDKCRVFWVREGVSGGIDDKRYNEIETSGSIRQIRLQHLEADLSKPILGT
jgi:hypothetical protein